MNPESLTAPALRFSKPTVVAFMGIPGAGKSTLANGLAREIALLRIISRDTIRAAMFDPCFYTREEKAAAFEGTLLGLRVVLGRGESALADGMCFSEIGPLERVEAASVDAGAAFVAVYCEVAVEEAVRRVEEDRRSGKHPALDRDGKLVRRIAAEFRTLPAGSIRVDMNRDLDEARSALIQELIARGTIA